MLKLYLESKGIKCIIITSIKVFFLEFSDTASKSNYDKEFVMDFPYENIDVRVNHEDLSPILYTTGYVPRKLIHKVQCEECN